MQRECLLKCACTRHWTYSYLHRPFLTFFYLPVYYLVRTTIFLYIVLVVLILWHNEVSLCMCMCVRACFLVRVAVCVTGFRCAGASTARRGSCTPPALPPPPPIADMDFFLPDECVGWWDRKQELTPWLVVEGRKLELRDHFPGGLGPGLTTTTVDREHSDRMSLVCEESLSYCR